MNKTLDRHIDRVTHADCITELAKLPDCSVDFVLTDPPYLIRYRDREGRRIINDGNDAWLLPSFSEVFRVLKPDSLCVSFYGWAKAEKFLWAWKQAGFYVAGHFVWHKKYASFVRYAKGHHEQAYLLAKGEPKEPKNPPPDVLGWNYTGNKLHPTQKPVHALKPLIEAYCPPDGIVLDPFAGSGTTGVAARECGRRFILIEKAEEHAATARKRLAA